MCKNLKHGQLEGGVWQHDILCISPLLSFQAIPKGSKMSASYFHIEPVAVDLTLEDVLELDLEQEMKITPNLTKIVAERKLPIKKGDIVGLLAQGEHPDCIRSEGCFIFDGSKVIPLDNSIDDYGAVPPSIKVSDTEFSITHWQDVVAHNNIFWLAQSILGRMTLHWDSEKRLYIGSTKIGKAAYACIIAPSDDEYLIEILNGKDVPPMEPLAKVLADLQAGKYYFDLNHGDLDCIDWDYQPAKMFYAMRIPEN